MRNLRYLMLIVPTLLGGWDNLAWLIKGRKPAPLTCWTTRVAANDKFSNNKFSDKELPNKELSNKELSNNEFLINNSVSTSWEQPLRITGQKLGKLPAETLVTGTLRFNLRNASALDAIIQAQQTPDSPQYQQWLSADEFGAQFGLDLTTYQALLHWMQQAGLTITQQWANRLSVEFTAPAAIIEQVWQTSLVQYRQGNQIYYLATEPPQIPASWTKVIASIKLHNFPQFQPQVRPASVLLNAQSAISLPTATTPTTTPPPTTTATTTTTTATGLSELRLGGQLVAGAADLHRVYQFLPLFAQGVMGQGQTIGIVARSDFELADLALFRTMSQLPPAKVVKIPIGNVVNRQGLDELEVLLDTQLAGVAAPAATVQVVIADRNSDIDQALAFLVNNLTDTKVISLSFNLCERDLTPAVSFFFNNLYKQAAAQGQTILVASGDAGANDCGDARAPQVGGLATSPLVTAVGGTSLVLAFDDQGNALDRLAETAWTGSGGGESLFYSRPDYQRQFSTSGRTIPDVALAADPSRPGLFIVQSGFGRAIGGTSAAAPLWAGIFSLVNQFANTTGVGQANTRIYQLGQQQQQGQTTVFQDIVVGNNNNNGVVGFMATNGYDLVTGWGAPNVTNFVTNFVHPDTPARQLFLLFPNGANLLPVQESTLVRWQINEPLASQVNSQDLWLSIDDGQTFQPLITGLNPTLRSFSVPLTTTTAQARFQIVARTAMQAVTDTSDAAVNIGTPLGINFAQYSTINKRLEIIGQGFTGKVQLIVNGKRSTRTVQILDAQTVVVAGKERKLQLRPGRNQIQLMVNGLRSATYVLML